MMPQAGGPSRPGLRAQLQVVRRRRWLIVLAVVIVVGVTMGITFLQAPVYEAKAELLLQPVDSRLTGSANAQVDNPDRAIQTAIGVLRSQPVRDLVRKDIGSAPPVSGASAGATDIMVVTAARPTAGAAARTANAYARAYVEFRQQQSLNALTDAMTAVQGRVRDLQGQIDALAPGDPERQLLLDRQSVFRQRLDQLQVNASLQSGGATLVTPASIPSSPSSPKPLRNAGFAVLGGLVLGLGGAFLLEHLDETIKDKEAAERACPDLPVLGLIPVVEGAAQGGARVVSITEPDSHAAEAFRSLQIALEMMSFGDTTRVVQVTSPNAQDGKSTVAANLGVMLARSGRRVIVISCDLRRPSLHSFFGLANEKGLTSVLLGETPLSDAMRPIKEEPGLAILPSGPVRARPAEILASERLSQVIGALAKQADIVVVDSPPVLPVADSLIVAGWCDLTMVVASATTTSRDLRRAVELLGQVDVHLSGLVLNKLAPNSLFGYGYGYQYYDARPGPVDADQRPPLARRAGRRRPSRRGHDNA